VLAGQPALLATSAHHRDHDPAGGKDTARDKRVDHWAVHGRNSSEQAPVHTAGRHPAVRA